MVYNVKTLYRRNIEEATQQQIFHAVALATKDAIIDAWLATQEQMKKQDPKIVYYMSMEFLMGRALGNNLINLTYYDEVKEALEELGCDLNVIEDQEPDAALGNGGLGRLAACFLDSLASLGYAAYGCGIRYRLRYVQAEDREWLPGRGARRVAQRGQSLRASPSGAVQDRQVRRYVDVEVDEKGKNHFVQKGYQSVRAVPCDMPIVGYATTW